MTTKLRNFALKHPYLALFMLCAFCAVFDRRNGGSQLLGVGILIVLQVISISIASIYIKKLKNIKHSVVFVAIMITLCAYLDYKFASSADSNKYLMFAGILAAFALLYLYDIKGGIGTNQIILIILIFGFLMRMTYVLDISINVNQHDFGGSKGHFAYIEYFYDNGFLKFPDVVAEGVDQKYHPPFYYMIAALWMKIQVYFKAFFFGLSTDNLKLFFEAKENLQILTLFFSSASMVISYKIFRSVNLKDNGLLIATSLVAFHPTFTILAGSANNDCLAVTLFLASILCALKWFENPTVGNIIKTALAIGFGMMTKLSVALVAPAVALLFAIKFFQSKAYKKLAKQLSAFAVFVFPLGLWWGIRNLIKSGVPITYVPRIPIDDHPQYIGFRSVRERLFDFSYTDVWMARGFSHGYLYHEYSLGLMILKTSLFGEYYIGKGTTWSSVFANILFYVNALVCIISLVSLVYFTIKRSKLISAPLRAFFAVLYITIMGSYVKFSFDFPHDCSMDFRYIVPTIIIGALFLAIALSYFETTKKRYAKAFSAVVYILAIMFFVCSFSIYTSISSLM